MANIQKYAQHALGHLCKHFERAKDENGEYIKFGNRNIDPTRTHLNYNLGPERESQYGFIMDRCKEVYCLKRKDVNLMCSCILTAPKDLPTSEHERFFAAAYEHLSKRYGEENVISAYVHKDEGSPHIHFAWVPVCYDEKKQRFAVSAKNVVTRKDLQTLHPDLEKHLSKALGHDVHVLTGELSDRPNLTIPQYQRLMETQTQLEKTEEKLKEAVAELKAIEPVLVKIQEIDSIQPKETLTGALKGITIEDVALLKAAAKRVPVIEKELEDLRIENKRIESKIPSIDEVIQNLERDRRLEVLEKAISKLPTNIQEQIEDNIRHPDRENNDLDNKRSR